MILRRITEHVQAQNWFAVGLDFFIVVVGVFIGLQVSNWNDARSLLHQEEAYLVELRGEIDANNQVLRNNIEHMNIIVTSGEQALIFLEGETSCETDCWRLLVDFFFASQVMATPISDTVFGEMQRLGLPRSSNIRSAMALYSNNGGATASISSELPEYREHIRGLMSVKAHRALWRVCHLTQPTETFITDCEAGISEVETRAVLEKFRARPKLHEQLSYWIGHNIAVLPTISDQIKFGEDVITAIDNELGNRK